ncbi:MAG TPA: glycerophosphodiester phosphodiesterase [Planctomycetota bacterium]|nr:glycerophosphodiester phosphodiesterase [Planctomycetota bacterium]
MLVYSHRGYPAGGHENTEEAFLRAIALGVDGIETDVRVTADGELILWHDRLSPSGRPIATSTLAEIEREAGFTVPRLSEILALFPHVAWNLEMKSVPAGERTLELLRKLDPATRILVSSFRHDLVARYIEETDLACGLLVAHRPRHAIDLVASFAGARRSLAAIVWCFEFMDADAAREARDLALWNFAYNVQTLEEHELAYAWGLDAVITDWPEHARATTAGSLPPADTRLSPQLAFPSSPTGVAEPTRNAPVPPIVPSTPPEAVAGGA